MHHFDVIILGRGIAGCTLAWQLVRQNAQVLLVDPLDQPAASQVAAGLLAPVGGKRFGLAWRAQQCWPTALHFYRSVESAFSRPVFQQRRFVRLFLDDQQQAEFHRRASGPLASFLLPGQPDLSIDAFCDHLTSGFHACGAQLDVPGYLQQTQAWFEQHNAFVTRCVQPDVDLRVTDHGIEIPRLQATAKAVVLCTGLAHEDWLRRFGVKFEPARGEVLRLESAGHAEQRVVQQGVWMAPLPDGSFKVGATFEPGQRQPHPTSAGREWLEQQLGQFFRRPYRVVGHSAGIRPILHTRRPLAGPLPGMPGMPGVAVLTGLGAHGTLWAPWLAERLTAWLLHGTPLPKEIDPAHRLK